ncbi:hypothetical protein F52700_12029 [Fusarium sp. NRRL 52700]|nr:hypothetical protein F52700_12029 [Fusarium sp. NRRL 52700]
MRLASNASASVYLLDGIVIRMTHALLTIGHPPCSRVFKVCYLWELATPSMFPEKYVPGYDEEHHGLATDEDDPTERRDGLTRVGAQNVKVSKQPSQRVQKHAQGGQ